MSTGTVTTGGVVSIGGVVSATSRKNGMVSEIDFVVGIDGATDSAKTKINADIPKNATKMKAIDKTRPERSNSKFITAIPNFSYIRIV
jgi:hypothetical protein